MQEGYGRWAASYQEEVNPIKANSDRLIEKWFPDVRNKAVLDAGCGTGRFCTLAEERGASTITGIDLSSEMIAVARKHATKTEFICGDLNAISIPMESFDLVLCALVLAHCEELAKPLSNLCQSVRPDGVLLITDFHPFLSLQNARRTFRDKAAGKTFEIQHYVHSLGEYFSNLPRFGLSMEELEEPIWQDNPVVFGIKSRKT